MTYIRLHIKINGFFVIEKWSMYWMLHTMVGQVNDMMIKYSSGYSPSDGNFASKGLEFELSFPFYSTQLITKYATLVNFHVTLTFPGL